MFALCPRCDSGSRSAMNRMRFWLTATAIVLACHAQGQPRGAESARHTTDGSQTNAIIPYKTLEDMFEPLAGMDTNKLEVHIFISSTNKAVPRSDIRMTIQSAAKGSIPLLLNTNGRILHFPLGKELRSENPPIVVNQPKGTLRIWVAIQIPPSDDLTFPYRRLSDGLAEMNKMIRAQAGWALSWLAPKVETMVFLFPKSGANKATVEIESASGPQKLTADKNGVVKLKLDDALESENPQVKLSEKPEHIVPDMSGL